MYIFIYICIYLFVCVCIQQRNQLHRHCMRANIFSPWGQKKKNLKPIVYIFCHKHRKIANTQRFHIEDKKNFIFLIR